MRKQEFLNQLAAALAGMDREERYRTISYYDELIDDRMEDGQDEEQAVAGLGDPGQVARELLVEEEPAVPKATGRKVWVIVLLVLGFPLWGSLLLAGVCLLLVPVSYTHLDRLRPQDDQGRRRVHHRPRPG